MRLESTAGYHDYVQRIAANHLPQGARPALACAVQPASVDVNSHTNRKAKSEFDRKEMHVSRHTINTVRTEELLRIKHESKLNRQLLLELQLLSRTAQKKHFAELSSGC